ncbi:glycosyltransferase BC10-like isoform X2 [Bidens hawaiensis]|uniref:glycosyltransferase BC10-like isoform X2 n=1 Tax=Bidens hawaiensis TaxID=980011 RepID=UPI004048F2CA
MTASYFQFLRSYRRPPLDYSKGKQNYKLQKQRNCIPDEHYVQTLLAMNDLEGELERRTVTYTSWIQSATNMETRSWHPVTYNYASANPQQIQRIKDINHVYYETEHRTEWCKTNGILVPCFLFARKFSRDGAMRLLA